MPECHGEHPMVWTETRTTSLFRRCDEVVPLQLGNGVRPVEREMDRFVESHGDWDVGDVEGQFKRVVVTAIAVYRSA